MQKISKVSEITSSDIADYIRLTEVTPDEENTLNTLLDISKDFIKKYTGIKDDETLDLYSDMVIVVLILCQDMYDNRTLYVDNTNLNKVVDTILGMHSINLL
jgi:hypothetical protein